MPCYSPITGYKARHVNPSGKRGIVFSPNAGYIDQPVTLPCGVCIGCRIDKSRDWALRCVHEAKLHPFNSFVTLTYDDEHLPYGNTLVKSDLQKFFKRLRHQYDFRYYACGEYGENSFRPHYHALLFGTDFHEDRKKHSSSGGKTVYVSDSLSEAWPFGHSLIGECNYASAAYVARYVMKKYYGKDPGCHYERTDPFTGEIYEVSPEFVLMSRRPGIGSGWYDRFGSDAFPSDYLVHQGKKHRVPRYYYNKLLKVDEGTAKDIKQLRKAANKNNPDVSPQRLSDRETVKKAQIKSLKRSI